MTINFHVDEFWVFEVNFKFSSFHFLDFTSFINMNNIAENLIGKELVKIRLVVEKIAIWISKIN